MLDLFNRKKVTDLSTQVNSQQAKLDVMSSYMSAYEVAFDGEKTPGELGRPREIYPDYYSARQRAWELQLTNDIAKLIMNKWSKWAIGTGLRFNATPPVDNKRIKNFNRAKFVDEVEYRFRLWKKSVHSDYAGMVSFDQKSTEAYYNAKTSGDVLAVWRVENKKVTVQLIDGANVCDPLNYSVVEGNYILEGVEYNAKGKHVAFHVYGEDNKTTRIKAYFSNGLKQAAMIYGSKFRLNETRGLPMLLEDFEKLKNIERFVDATVKNAEVSSELIFVNQHDNSSTGENIFKNAAMGKISTGTADVNEEWKSSPKCFQTNLARATKGTAINNTIGGDLKMLKPNAESTMPDFLESNLKLVFASAGIPYEVALSVYNSNYSASRAAIKDWEHNLKVETAYFATQFHQPFYELWLYNEVLIGNIDAYQLIDAYRQKDYITIQALNTATFTGVAVPSIDPLKEVNAVRKALGADKDNIPLMTLEQASEIVSQKDYTEIQKQMTTELAVKSEPVEQPVEESINVIPNKK